MANEPWFNDGDKVAGLAGTILMLGAAACIVIVFLALTLKFAIWLV